MSPSPGFTLSRRQLWSPPTRTTAAPTPYCTAFPLPASGVISLADSVITLTTDVVFQPACTGGIDEGLEGYPSVIADWKDPFYASTTPQTYVIAAATVIAWILVFMLIITPRTTFFGTSVSHPGLGGKHGIIGGANGGGSHLGVGSRPWLQKVAAFTVAVSLTIATADTFKSLEKQYALGYMDATAMREDVMGSLEIRITRVISDVFIWLAQVQTLVRLFPRHKEKVIIKWIGFGLIVCDTLFSCLNSFYANVALGKPRHFVDAIPALSYLFQLALGLLYAAWVIYYSMTKRRYAFYHAKMRSITLIAILSFVAVLTPVVFFITDVSNQDVAGWGDYFRWVGAAAASVIVWEWVERIEAIECDDKKDGILGREIFDGDEMLDVNPSNEFVWNSGRRGLARLRNGGRRGDDNDDDKGAGGDPTSAMEKGFHGFTARFKKPQPPAPKHYPLGRAHSQHTEAPTDGSRTGTAGSGNVTFGRLPRRRGQRNRDTGITPPPAVASPVSRTDTTSAASTVYVVRYDNEADVPQPIRRRVDASGNAILSQDHRDSTFKDPEKEEDEDEAPHKRERAQHGRWHTVANPFKRKRASPPAEVQKARDRAGGLTRSMTPAHNFSKWDIKNRLGVLAAETGERFRDRNGRGSQEADVPITIIPAQPRGSNRTWSPEILVQQQEQQQQQQQQQQRQRTRDSTLAAAGALPNNEASDPTDISNSTTLTSNSLPAAEAASRNSNTPRANELSAGGTTASPTVIQSPRRHMLVSRDSFSRQYDPPPRADDISPSAGSTGTVVVPAPRRSPLRAVTTTPPTSHDEARAGNTDNGGERGPADSTPQRQSPLRNQTTPSAGTP